MIFSSYAFIFLFLPISLIGYYAFGMFSRRASQLWLLTTSIFFYGYWNWNFVPLLLGSIAFNYYIGTRLFRQFRTNAGDNSSKLLLTTGIVGNLALLGYFKYTGFFIGIAHELGILNGTVVDIVLPIGISFFTFTQIAFLVDADKGRVQNLSLINYGLFVTFFPHLLAGPILHHREMMPQFDRKESIQAHAYNVAPGLLLFAIGLVKKVAIADQFAPLANIGYENWALLTTTGAWLTTTAYTLQLYFDFSGYTDMALGIALFFNIELPINFNSPYKATDIQDFWRRWHMTLSRFLRDYLYIPLGGNQLGELMVWRNFLLVFLLGGFWHGAGWTFVIWGALHGMGMCVHRAWQRMGMRLPRMIAWAITILFIHITWIPFRSKTFVQSWTMTGKLFCIHGDQHSEIGIIGLIDKVAQSSQTIFFRDSISESYILYMTLFFGCIVVFAPNSGELRSRFKPGWIAACAVGGGIGFSIILLSRVSEFLYFNF